MGENNSILFTTKYFAAIPVFSAKLIKIVSFRISFHPDKYIIINFCADYCLHVHSLRSPTLEDVSNLHQIPKDTNYHQQRFTNLHCRNPLFIVHVFSSHTQKPHILLLI